MGNKQSGQGISKVTNEKYIVFDKYSRKFAVVFKGKVFARFKILREAIMCRDKYLSEYE